MCGGLLGRRGDRRRELLPAGNDALDGDAERLGVPADEGAGVAFGWDCSAARDGGAASSALTRVMLLWTT